MSETLEQDFDSEQPQIHLAIVNQDLELLSVLLEEQNSLNQQNLYGYTPLETAARHGNTNILSSLIDRGADVNFQGVSTPLHEAVVHGHFNAVILLIQKGANVNARIGEAETPLMNAESVDIVKLLVESDADIDARDANNYSAGLKAILRGNYEVYNQLSLYMGSEQKEICETEKLVQLIRQGEISIFKNAMTLEYDTNLRDREGWTLLMNCAIYNQLEIAKFLLERGANTHLTTDSGDTALMIAEEEGHAEVAKLIKRFHK
jgi:uncharacterized protein